MKNSEQIPSHLFDMIEAKDFESLTDAEKAEATLYFTGKEYNELHMASVEAKQLHDDMFDVSSSVNDSLMQAFGKKYALSANKERSVILYPVQLWKVAALFLLFAGSVLWIVHLKPAQKTAYITIKDTVYIPSFTSNENTIKVYDTVYRDAEPLQSFTPKNNLSHRIKRVIDEPREQADYSSVYVPPVNLLTLGQKDDVPNRQKGNSLKDDTLLQYYRFVGL